MVSDFGQNIPFEKMVKTVEIRNVSDDDLKLQFRTPGLNSAFTVLNVARNLKAKASHFVVVEFR